MNNILGKRVAAYDMAYGLAEESSFDVILNPK
jgi:hypothetical protein